MSIKKLDLKSPDLVNENFEKLATLFPNCVTEGAEGKAIDFDLLKQELSHAVVEGNKERYRLEWPGKREAIVTANLPTTKTLRPVREDSVDFDNTENLYIEGDNLEVLKLLQESYLGKIKMIYIDPPYNTGRDFIYTDNFKQDKEMFEAESGFKSEDGQILQRLKENPETAAKYHSNWLTMIYPRIKLARNLLSKNGVIFISIGDQELSNLLALCNEVFGEGNRVGLCARLMKSGSNQGKHFSKNLDYVLVYAKDINNLKDFRERLGEDLIKKVYTNIQSDGNRRGERYRTMGLYQSSLEERINQRFFIECPDGSLCIPPGETMPSVFKEGEKVIPKSKEGVWRWTFQRFLDEKSEGNIDFKETSNSPLVDSNGNQSKWNVYTKIWLKDRQDEGKLPVDLITKFENRHSSKEIQKLEIPFDFAKPVGLIEFLLEIVDTDAGDIVLDFFSGSSSTAHAVLSYNANFNESLKHIMVQLPEPIDEKASAYRQGYKNICEIGKERIRRAAKKIKEETKADIDYGFRVYRLDSSNMHDVYYKPQDYDQNNLDLFGDNVKSDRTADDLLAQVMLDSGLPLSLKIEQVDVSGKKVFKVAENSLYACFDSGIDEDFAKAIAQDEPLRIVFKDSGFKNDTAKSNVKQLLKQLSPETEMKVI